MCRYIRSRTHRFKPSFGSTGIEKKNSPWIERAAQGPRCVCRIRQAFSSRACNGLGAYDMSHAVISRLFQCLGFCVAGDPEGDAAGMRCGRASSLVLRPRCAGWEWRGEGLRGLRSDPEVGGGVCVCVCVCVCVHFYGALHRRRSKPGAGHCSGVELSFDKLGGVVVVAHVTISRREKRRVWRWRWSHQTSQSCARTKDDKPRF